MTAGFVSVSESSNTKCYDMSVRRKATLFYNSHLLVSDRFPMVNGVAYSTEKQWLE